MVIKESSGEKVFKLMNIFIMLLLVFVTLYPMIHVINASLSNGKKLLAHSGLLIFPVDCNFSAYTYVFRDPMIVKGYMNTAIVVVFGVILNIVMTAIGAYFLSRKNVFWSGFVFYFIIFTMLFRGGTIPFYFTVTQLGMDNSLLSLIIPTAINTFNLIIMRTSFLSIPKSMEESAKLDGASHITILTRIILPLSMPIVAVMILYYAVERWNAWFHAMLFIKDRTLLPLQLILRGILLQNDTTMMTAGTSVLDQETIGEPLKYAVIVIATLPILFAYPFLQKYFIKGMMIGAVKE